MKNNNKISRIAILCLFLYLIQSVFFLILLKFHHFRSGIIDWTILLICGIVFLIWYYRVSSNYDLLSNSNSASKNLLYWFIPLANSLLVFIHLKRIYVEYSSKDETKNPKYNPASINKALYIWFLFFVLMYAASIYISESLPFLPDDIEMYYALNPNVEFHHGLTKVLIDAVGIFSIIYVIKAITELENSLYNATREIDIINHLVIEE